jgi:hypothetical protein
MMSMTYVSTATEQFGDAEIAALLRHSRQKNARRGLTGFLLFKEGQFMQVLEGEDDQVRELYAVIAADPRHTAVRTLLSDPITERQFSTWSMGFRVVTDETLKDIPGYDDILSRTNGRQAPWDEPTRAQWLLNWFRTHSV